MRFPKSEVFCACLVAMVLVNVPSVVAGEDPQLAPYVRFLDVDCVIENSYAITTIAEGLENPNEHPVDYDFTFDMPEEAFISNFSLTVDGETVYADILEKEKASEKYENAVNRGSNAGLVESRGESVFSYSISLAAKKTTVVGLRYEEYILRDRGTYTYELSLIAAGGRLTLEELSVDVEIDYITRIQSVRVPNHSGRSTIERENENKVKVSYNEDNVSPEENFIVEYEVEKPPLEGMILKHFDGEESFFFHVFSPGVEDVGRLDKEIIFVVDRSGSMSGDKIKQAKEAFAGIADQLPEDDRLNVVFFNSQVQEYDGHLVEASDANKDKVVGFIKSLSATGGTNINSALLRALQMFEYDGEKAQIIVFLTDGMPTSGVTGTKTIRNNVRTANTECVSIYSLGLGSNVKIAFLEALSLENYGFALEIYTDADVRFQISDFYERISVALLRNLEFGYSEGTYEIYPGHVDYLFEGSECVVTGKFLTEMTHIDSSVSAQSKTGTMYFNESFDLEDSGNYSFIPRFWAYNKIQHLLDRIAVEGEIDWMVKEIINLSVEYHFVTPYTSLFLEVNDEVSTTTDSPVSSDKQDSLAITYNYQQSGGNPTQPPSTSTPTVLSGQPSLSFSVVGSTQNAPSGGTQTVMAVKNTDTTVYSFVADSTVSDNDGHSGRVMGDSCGISYFCSGRNDNLEPAQLWITSTNSSQGIQVDTRVIDTGRLKIEKEQTQISSATNSEPEFGGRTYTSVGSGEAGKTPPLDGMIQFILLTLVIGLGVSLHLIFRVERVKLMTVDRIRALGGLHRK